MILFMGGLFLGMLWVLNWGYLFYIMIKHTPNWRDPELDSDGIVNDFLKNVPIETLLFTEKVATLNESISPIAIILLVAGIILI